MAAPMADGTGGVAAVMTYKVTPAEKEVLILLAEGFTARHIAELRCTSVRTVERQIGVLNRTFDVHDRATLLAKAKEAGVL